MPGIHGYVGALLRGRRPRPFRASAEDAAVARVAITLRSARPGSGAAAEEFVTGLHRKLAEEIEDRQPRPGAPASRRRAFMQAACVAACAAAAGAGLDHLVAAPAGTPAAASGARVVPDDGSWQAVLPGASLPEGAVLPFTAATLTGFVQRTGGRLRAVSGVCTHQGCPLELARSATELDCPCHGAVFALDGTVLRHRLSIRLAALPEISVREAGGTVQVYAPRPTAAPGEPPPPGGQP